MKYSGKNQIICLINFIYFEVGLLVSIISALIPDIINSYKVGYAVAAGLPFAFYISFTFFCIPAGMASQKWRTRRVLIVGFLMALTGSLVFAIFPSYYIALASLFLIGGAVAVIQVCIVPLLRSACGAHNLAFHSTLNQLMYGLGAFSSPIIFSFLTSNLQASNTSSFFTLLSKLILPGFEWVAAYWVFVVLIIATLLILLGSSFSGIESDSSENAGFQGNVVRSILSQKYFWFYFTALTAYASAEQGIAMWMSKYFENYFAIDPSKEGARVLSSYWMLLSLGCVAGLPILKLFNSRRVLCVCATMAILSTVLALSSGVAQATLAFPAIGLFESLMWPIILSLAVNSSTAHHKVLTGFFYTATLGGAVGPYIIGAISDQAGLRSGYFFVFIPFVIVLSTAFWSGRASIGSPPIAGRDRELFTKLK